MNFENISMGNDHHNNHNKEIEKIQFSSFILTIYWILFLI